MSGYYPPNHQFPQQFYNVNPNAVPDPNLTNVSPLMPPDVPMPHGLHEGAMYQPMPGSFVSYGEPHMQQPYMGPFEDGPPSIEPTQAAGGRMRRRPAPGDHVKHRRTRSGCFTCRNRRVKCDETHPICERCRKGNRECVYPEPQSASKSARGSAKGGQKSPGETESSPENPESDAKEPLSAIQDEDEEDDYEDDPALSSSQTYRRETSDTPSLTHDRSPSPSTEASSNIPSNIRRPVLSRTTSNQATKPTPVTSKSSPNLPEDVKFYLNYFRTNITHHHYSLKRDGGNFLKTAFLELVIKHEPLRYAVVGFAAYFHTLSQPDGKMYTFLQYYNESVSKLRELIQKSKKQSLATFLTILQLASIEEMLGDWVNLQAHQKAAFDILTRLYTPQSMTKTELMRKVLLWYVRFDLFVGFQSGGEAILGREWYVAVHEWYEQQAQEHPDDLTYRYEERFAYSRLVAKDSADLFAKKARGLLSDEEFMAQLSEVAESVNSLDKNIDPMLLDPCDFVTDFTGTPDPDDIVNPYEPNVIWGGPRWTSNYLLLDMWGIIFMFNIQMSMVTRKSFDPELTRKAYRAAQVFEAVCAYPKGLPGAIIEAQASLAIASIFLPKDPKTIQWCRRTFIKVESTGYIYSSTLRNRFLEQWGLEPSDWWLPNDELCPPIIRTIKNFISERTTAPKDQASEDLREMKGLFSTLTISDSPSSDNTSNTPIEGVLGNVGVPAGIDNTLIYTSGSPEYDWSHEQQKVLSADAFVTGPLPEQ
ncbi:hypothetical protein EJ04DRAFT_363804 [Polyplosphaeria fusca]|uniref:Zn(2)-C6 fungal-type domain-containing protein n=1 Tax=Polyplosphaeria fusca TaxID=682080 RepID=A0A9P4QVE4_9PLEO|nr:hypothetical protein EJ04DRAFT_363804 [Polyplosphaeria fusca]